jgi:uncharacterized small protein (DUF1192 family)
MAIEPEEPRKRKPDIVLGEDLSEMSEPELVVRIAALETEILRSREAIASRQSSKSAADSFFRKS